MKKPSIIDNTYHQLMGFKIFNGILPQLDRDQKLIINTINAYSTVLSLKDEKFKEALDDSDILLPDGVSMVIAAKILSNKNINKIAGMDAFNHYLNELNRIGGSCFFLGSNGETLTKIQLKITRKLPGIRVGVYSPPYKAEFNNEDTFQMINEVRSFRPDVLFVGMTAPKQEKWVYENKYNLNIPIICSIGAVFDYYAENLKRAPKIARDIGLEWFWRLMSEPKRTWKRYIIGNTQFLLLLFKHKIFGIK